MSYDNQASVAINNIANRLIQEEKWIHESCEMIDKVGR